jgi:AbrB family looped-hinge helix DNA binding protein
MAVEHHSLYVGQKGRILLPADLRKRLKLNEGDRLIATVAEDGVITLIPAETLACNLRGSMKNQGGSVNGFLSWKKKQAKSEQSELS